MIDELEEGNGLVGAEEIWEERICVDGGDEGETVRGPGPSE